MSIVIAILVISLIIIVHEFGHFIVAKANSVTVLEFSIGFGPKLLHFKKGETEYCIKLIPFGGACMMLGEDFLENSNADDKYGEKDNDGTGMISDKEVSDINNNADTQLKKEYDMSKSLQSKSVWARIAIIAAGPLFNFILAFILAVIIIGIAGYDPCTVDKVYDDSPAAHAGLMEGDHITKVNGETIHFEREYSFIRMVNPSDKLNITYERNGESFTTTVEPEYRKESAYRVGITILSNCMINSVTKDSPAAQAGLKKDDIIKSVDGQQIYESGQLTDILSQTKDKTVEMVISSGGQEKTVQITPKLYESESYYTGFVCNGERVKANPQETIGYGFCEVGYWIKTVVKSLGMMFTGKVGLNDLSGPVGTVSAISSVVDESKSYGISQMALTILNWIVMISANLGVMNLLPIPALDGGRLVFLIIEAVRGKPVKKEREGMVHFVGMVLLMLLMVYVMFNDIKGLF